MIDELIDLTTMQPSKVLRTRFTRSDLLGENADTIDLEIVFA